MASIGTVRTRTEAVSRLARIFFAPPRCERWPGYLSSRERCRRCGRRAHDDIRCRALAKRPPVSALSHPASKGSHAPLNNSIAHWICSIRFSSLLALAWRGLSDLEALEYWDLHQVYEDREGDGRSERPADHECRQRRH